MIYWIIVWVLPEVWFFRLCLCLVVFCSFGTWIVFVRNRWVVSWHFHNIYSLDIVMAMELVFALSFVIVSGSLFRKYLFLVR